MRESSVQRKIIKQMEKEGWMVIKIIRANMAGLPDLLLLRDGVARWVEVKQPGKKPTALQSARHALLRRIGFSVEVMDTIKHNNGRQVGYNNLAYDYPMIHLIMSLNGIMNNQILYAKSISIINSDFND